MYKNNDGKFDDFCPSKADDFYFLNKKNKKVIDFSCNFGQISLFNFSSSIVEKSIIDQLHHGFLFQSSLIRNEQADKLSRKLCNLAGFGNSGTTLFYNSTTEANECAIKIARTRYNILCERDYNEIICFKGSNHGCSIAISSINKNDNFAPFLNGFKIASINDIFSVEKAISEHTCAIMVEVVQYDDGIKVCEKDFIKKLRKICSKHEILLIFDETHCGSSRSGKNFFSYNEYGVIPDIVTSGGFCGGFSFSACTINEDLIEFIDNINNNTSYGNILCCNIANNIINEFIKQDFLKNINKISKLFEINLKKIAEKYSNVISSVNVFGLMISIKINDNIKNYRFAEILLSNGLIASITGENSNEILLFPPLNINEDKTKEALKIILISIKEISIIESY